MLISKENRAVRDAIFGFERRIEEMHLGFQRYRYGDEPKMPDWERLERELLSFSRRKIMDLELSNHMDRVLHKFQNRKKIWLDWIEQFHHSNLPT
ncbi:MAG: hypothetical protein JW821_09990 [Deltaproteobacteria bacterium]|nr:hypothetical protein [Deltaproteobacteria bacterium]